MKKKINNEVKQRNYTPFIWIVSVLLIVIVLSLNYLPRILPELADDKILGVKINLLPLINAILNGIAFIFLVLSLIMIKKRNIDAHRNYIFAAFIATFFFLITYVTYHAVAGSTNFGGEGFIAIVYYVILITHIILAAVVLPLSLITLTRGLNMQVEKHRKIARWTMPIWLYVSATGVIVYLLIAPYY